MSGQLIIVEKRGDFRWADPDMRVLTAQEFIAEEPSQFRRPRKIINLCRSYRYLSIGYYVSLLAEARGDRVTPNVETIVDLQQKQSADQRLGDLNRAVGALGDVPRSVNAITVQVLFGQIEDASLAELARRSFEMFRCPLWSSTSNAPMVATAGRSAPSARSIRAMSMSAAMRCSSRA